MLTVIDIHEAMFTHFTECNKDPFCIEIECPQMGICAIVAAAMVRLIDTGEYH